MTCFGTMDVHVYDHWRCGDFHISSPGEQQMHNNLSEQAVHEQAVLAELSWLETLIEARLAHSIDAKSKVFPLTMPHDHDKTSALGALIADADLDTPARCVLALALAQFVNPVILEPLFAQDKPGKQAFARSGGQTLTRGVLQPSTETALYLIAGTDTALRVASMKLFEPDHSLSQRAGVKLVKAVTKQPGDHLDIPLQRVVALCKGVAARPDKRRNFPARRLTSGLSWNDLILPASVMDTLDHILAWLQHRDEILEGWGLAHRFGRGYAALFSGPSGTGKTLTATLLGQRTGQDVFRIDLSLVGSTNIRETRKTFKQIFDRAEERNWILFFDEADALFAARTSASAAHDRYANQEVSYLLQRIEEYQGLVILATHSRSSIDNVIARRIQIAVPFSQPKQPERLRLWRNILARLPMEPDVDIEALAQTYELSGASIVSVVRHAAISAKRNKTSVLTNEDIEAAIGAQLRQDSRNL